MVRLFKNITLFIAYSFIMVFIFEITCRLIPIPKITNHNIFSKSQNLIPLIDKNTVLILGDSRLEWGIKPLIMNSKLAAPTQVINLALPGSNGIDILNYLKKEKVYPKLIILGYTPNYGKYKNHNMDRKKYNPINKMKEKVAYFIAQTFYINDGSVNEYIHHKPLYFKDHMYDSLGGAIVNEYGDYNQRFRFQKAMYEEFKTSFDSVAFNNYCKEVNGLIAFFENKGSVVCGLYMPVSQNIYNIENSIPVSKKAKPQFKKMYEFSDFTYDNETLKNDSIYFYDGSHLSHGYSYIFSEKLIDRILIDYPFIR